MNSVWALNFTLVRTLLQVIKTLWVRPLLLHWRWSTKVRRRLFPSLFRWIDRLNHWRVAVLLKPLIGRGLRRLLPLSNRNDSLFLRNITHRKESKTILFSTWVRIIYLFVVKGAALVLFSHGRLLFDLLGVHFLNDRD